MINLVIIGHDRVVLYCYNIVEVVIMIKLNFECEIRN